MVYRHMRIPFSPFTFITLYSHFASRCVNPLPTILTSPSVVCVTVFPVRSPVFLKEFSPDYSFERLFCLSQVTWCFFFFCELMHLQRIAVVGEWMHVFPVHFFVCQKHCQKHPNQLLLYRLQAKTVAITPRK